MRVIPQFSALSADFAKEILLENATQAKRRLATLYLSAWDFDEEWYIVNNPDLAEAIPSQVFPSGWHHFVNVGYFEGRSPAEPFVDSDWYMSQYADVASAILDGVFSDARQHYVTLGRAEGRIPCDPEIDPGWYGKRYIENGDGTEADKHSCTEHFLRFGYLNGALAAPPR